MASTVTVRVGGRGRAGRLQAGGAEQGVFVFSTGKLLFISFWWVTECVCVEATDESGGVGA